MTSCVEDLLDVTFDYPLGTSFVMSDQIEANMPTVIESEMIELDLGDELADRNLGAISSVKIKSLEVILADGADIDWSVLESLELKMMLDNETYSMASFGDNSVIEDRTLTLEVTADEFHLEEFINLETAQVQLHLETNTAIMTEVPMEAKAVIAITASPIQ
ncbi:MAG: hypothetical protein AAFQ87_15200 [Bacteroidota bacterium]